MCIVQPSLLSFLLSHFSKLEKVLHGVHDAMYAFVQGLWRKKRPHNITKPPLYFTAKVLFIVAVIFLFMLNTP